MARHDNQVTIGGLPFLLSCLLSVLSFFLQVATLSAANISDAERLFFSGDYAGCETMAAAEVERGVWNEKWPAILLRCQLTTGQYSEAEQTYEVAKTRFKNSIALRMIGHEVYNFVDKPEIAKQQYGEIVALVQRAPWRYSSSTDRVVIGRFLLAGGEDAREVLELAYDRARRSNPKLPDVYIATAELALEKHDYQEAAKAIERALELQPHNPHVHLISAKAWAPSDPEKATASVQQALELNDRHIPTLLFQVDNLVDSEQFEMAEELLERAFEVNDRHPEAWAYRAVIAHLRGEPDEEKDARQKALTTWSTNPYVDHLIGRKLSRNYRFAEGAKYQQQALAFDPTMLAAKLQLSQDYLRLGREDEGWKLADEVHEADGYNVVAYNAVTLRDEMAKYATIETDRFLLRMEDRESRIYGPQVIELLNEAHDFLCSKYEVELDGQVTVEIFPQQKDFAIRTFGLPGGAGFLGVCFGRVITANSPSSQGSRPANWRSVLWHEFCHVVTLEKTRNKMPRWLSEGISTFEEQEKDEGWGERLTPSYRRMIDSDEELTPVSQLSAAFLNPKSPEHLQFAYFESALVVRFLIERHGLLTLKRILTDLGVGMPINEALTRYVGSLDVLDEEFAQYARKFAAKSGGNVDWEFDEALLELDMNGTGAWLTDHPDNYFALMRYAQLAIEAKDFDKARNTLERLRALYPEDREADGILAQLIRVYRQMGDEENEIKTLRTFARLNDRALEAYQRLIEVDVAQEDWAAVQKNAKRYLAVQPMIPFGHEQLATSAQPRGESKDLAAALTALLEMDPVDPAKLLYRISQAHLSNGDAAQAKRTVLMALEYAPRYRDAQQLLLELVSLDGEEIVPEVNAETAVETSDVQTDGGS